VVDPIIGGSAQNWRRPRLVLSLELCAKARTKGAGPDKEARVIKLRDDNGGFFLRVGEIVAIDFEAVFARIINRPTGTSVQSEVSVDPVE